MRPIYIRVTNHKFMCLKHTKANQTETSGFRAEKGLIAGREGNVGAHTPKSYIYQRFQQSISKGRMRSEVEECVITGEQFSDCLVMR